MDTKSPSVTTAPHTTLLQQHVGPSRSLTIMDRFGRYAIFALLAGSWIIAGCVAFIAFLWNADSGNPVWAQIVTAGWIPRSITIAAVLLRGIVTAQAALCTSMIASLLLGGFQISLADAAAVSVMRFTNTGPTSLLQYLPRTLQPKALLLTLMALLMSLSTLILQFTSTILLSDVNTSSISQSQSLSTLPYGINASALIASQSQNIGFLGVKPAVYPAFAEYTEPAYNVDGASDTGLSIRAFLPFDQSASRELIRSYQGMATLVDTRVVCVRPSFEDVKLFPKNGGHRLMGNISTRVTPPRLNQTAGVSGSTVFDCMLAIQGVFWDKYATTHEWPLAMCFVNQTNRALISDMNPVILPDHMAPSAGVAWLLINTTGSFNDWGMAGNVGGSLPIIDYIELGPWLRMTTQNANLTLQATLCYESASSVQDTSVYAYRTSETVHEAVSGWRSETSTFETNDIRRQLGATKKPLTSDQRGILTLARKESWLKPPSLEKSPNGGWQSVSQPTTPETVMFDAFNGLDGTSDDPVMLCAFCQPGGKIKTAPVHSAMISDILKETESPALALQAFFTTLFGMAYMGRVSQFDALASANLTADVPVIKPTSKRFFIGFMATAALHLLLVALIAVVFAFVDGNSRLGNAWSSVAQLKSPETEYWLDTAKTMSDKELKRAMATAGWEGVVVATVDAGERLVWKRQ